jgi:hypothetical protein
MLIRGISLIALGALVAGCGDTKKAFDESFDKSFHEKLISSCTSSAVGSGAPQEIATRLCTCASDKVKERYTVSEKMNLKQDQLQPIVAECRAEVLG